MERGSNSDSANCLKFGKKVYFAESSSSSSKPHSSSPPPLAPPPATVGRRRKAAEAQPPRCQVEGCNVDLTGSKPYYCRHKVCGTHSKAPLVVVAGVEQRFCQQCSRYGYAIDIFSNEFFLVSFLSFQMRM
jgi:SBP domain